MGECFNKKIESQGTMTFILLFIYIAIYIIVGLKLVKYVDLHSNKTLITKNRRYHLKPYQTGTYANGRYHLKPYQSGTYANGRYNLKPYQSGTYANGRYHLNLVRVVHMLNGRYHLKSWQSGRYAEFNHFSLHYTCEIGNSCRILN